MQAQTSLTDVLQGVAGAILGTSVTSTADITGTWTYVQPAVEFESEDALSNAGGAIAAKTLVTKLTPLYNKIGIKAGSFTFVFNADKTFVSTIGKKTVNGTWSFDAANKKITLQLGTTQLSQFTTYMTVSGSSTKILFNANKLLSVLKAFTGSSTNTTLVTINALTKSYSGMYMGFEMTKK